MIIHFSKKKKFIIKEWNERSASVRIDELLKTVENLSKQLNEVKSRQVRIVCDF